MDEAPGAFTAASAWRSPASVASRDDPLLGCLQALAALLGRPVSAPALAAGLPLADGLLTPELFPRAAARAGLSARLIRCRLADIDPLSLPCVLLLDDRRACVLVRADAERCTVVVPETGTGTTEVACAELERRHLGAVLFAAPQAAPRPIPGRDPKPATIGSGACSGANGRSSPKWRWRQC